MKKSCFIKGFISHFGLIVALLLVLPRLAFPIHMEGFVDVGAGGGYEDNLNNASSSDLKEGSGFMTVWITLNVWKDIFEDARLAFSGGYEGNYYPSFSDITENGYTVWGELNYSPTDSIVLDAEPWVGLRSYGERERDSTIYGISLALKKQINPEFGTAIGYEFMKNSAEESVFRYNTNAVSIHAEVNAIPTARLTIGYILEFTKTNLYQPKGLPAPPGAHGRRPSETFGSSQEVFKAGATANRISVGWDQELYEGIHVLVSYLFSYVRSDPGNYRDHVASGSVGYRF
jgi:hypothetical protein